MWSDSVFRENPKYYGDVKPTINSVYDKGLSNSGKYFGFSNNNNIGIIPTDFNTFIDEKEAQGRRSEYGSKVFTTKKIINCITPDNNILNNSLFSLFKSNIMYSVHNGGILNIWELPNKYFNLTNDIKKPKAIINGLSQNATVIDCHPNADNVLTIGCNDAIYTVDLTKLCIVNSIKNINSTVTSIQYNKNGELIRALNEKGNLLSFDPRNKPNIKPLINSIKCSGEEILHLNVTGDKVCVAGLTGFKEPILKIFDLKSNDISTETDKINYGHKQCRSLIRYDKYTNILYATFRTVADLICFTIKDNIFEKQALYNGVKDTFYGFVMYPKNNIKSREINKCVKLSKNRIQLINHTKGGKLIYKSLPKKIKTSVMTCDDYFIKKLNTENLQYDLNVNLVPSDFKETKKRTISLFLHINGILPKNVESKYSNLICSKTINTVLGRNLVTNETFMLFPSNPISGGGLGIINIDKLGRRNQIELRCHKEPITCFDISNFNNNVITGSSDAKVYIWNIPDNIFTKKSDGKCKQLQTLKFEGKVTFVSFNERIKNLCTVGARTNTCNNMYIYNCNDGTLIKKIKINDNYVKDINDIQYEPLGNQTLCAVTSQDKYIKLIDVKNGKIIYQFKCLENMRDTKLFWVNNNGKYFTKLLCLGFRKGSLRAFGVYNIESIVTKFYNGTNIDDQKNNDDDSEAKNDENKDDDDVLKPECEMTFGISNSVPLGYYDSDSNIFYYSSVGDRSIRIFELKGMNNELREMNSKCIVGSEIIGMSFKYKQLLNVKDVEIGYVYVLTRKEVLPISFVIPRKRKEFFQDDLYLNGNKTLNMIKESININDYIKYINNEINTININLDYINLKPNDMKLLSLAPKEELTDRQKRRKSQIALMEAQKLKEQPQSQEQAFEAFSRMVADAPSSNQWDATPIASEVNDDEWDD